MTEHNEVPDWAKEFTPDIEHSVAKPLSPKSDKKMRIAMADMDIALGLEDDEEQEEAFHLSQQTEPYDSVVITNMDSLKHMKIDRGVVQSDETTM